jgi:hypothetical protein
MGTLASGTATFATSTLAAGSHSITAQYGGDANYAGSTSTPLAQIVNAPAADFSVAASASSVTVAAGQTGMVRLTVTPVNGSTQTVTLNCAGLPTGSACTFMPTSVMLDGTHAGMAQLMISTTARTAQAMKVASAGTPPKFGRMLALLSIFMIAILGLALVRPRRAMLRIAMAALVLALPVTILVACGGSSGGAGTPAGTYLVTITASSSGDSHTVPVSLIVQ